MRSAIQKQAQIYCSFGTACSAHPSRQVRNSRMMLDEPFPGAKSVTASWGRSLGIASVAACFAESQHTTKMSAHLTGSRSCGVLTASWFNVSSGLAAVSSLRCKPRWRLGF
jgi:hypothetical protein